MQHLKWRTVLLTNYTEILVKTGLKTGPKLSKRFKLNV